jgi:hypothetical protein
VSEKPHIWVLNPGAERELLPGASADRRTVAQMKARQHLFDGLCAGEDRTWLNDLAESRREPRIEGRKGRRALLWCPVPSAVRLCLAHGLSPQNAPKTSVFERVLSKAFLGEALPAWTPPAHRRVNELADVRQAFAKTGGALRAKRLDGYAGKGQRTLRTLDVPAEVLWIESNLRGGGLIVEAELTVLGEFSIHGVVGKHGVLIGTPCRLQMDDARAPLSVPTACPDAPRAVDIEKAGYEAASALEKTGYFGPFGLDLILAESGLYATDLNARFTLGFSAGMGARRPRAIEWVLDSR